MSVQQAEETPAHEERKRKTVDSTAADLTASPSEQGLDKEGEALQQQQQQKKTRLEEATAVGDVHPLPSPSPPAATLLPTDTSSSFLQSSSSAATASSIAGATTGMKKLAGYAFWKSIGSPRTVLAPMVDQSHLAWRILARRYGADLCYTPMIHARIFANQTKKTVMTTDFLPPYEIQQHEKGPTFAQFCANDPEEWLKAAKKILAHQPAIPERYQAFDLNLGCPQDIARRGKYGAYLQDHWETIAALISTLHSALPIPITAKIRIFEDKARTIEYAKMIEQAGAQVLTVHGRLREQRGHKTGLADWSIIKQIKAALKIPVIANGNILHPGDIEKCLQETGCDAVMSAEGHLYNPAIFLPGPVSASHYPRCDALALEYIAIVQSQVPDTAWGYGKGHLFKLLKMPLKRFTAIRDELGRARSFEQAKPLVETLQKSIDDAITGEKPFDPATCEKDDQGLPRVPWYLAQPYVRPPWTDPKASKIPEADCTSEDALDLPLKKKK